MADTTRQDATRSDLNMSATSVGSKVGRSHKPRTKGLLKKLQSQVEFYFGDANLPKDKFLQQKMAEDPNRYVPVSVIASFKKMSSLTEDLGLILKAIKNSTQLQLSENSKGVRRATPLPDHTPSEVDARTVYVENLSTQNTTHESVKKLFKAFGEVTYVSLPRYKASGDIKGFAFVEFSSKKGADSAVAHFKDEDVSTDKPPTTDSEVFESETTPTGRKRKREDDSDQETDESTAKRSKPVTTATRHDSELATTAADTNQAAATEPTTADTSHTSSAPQQDTKCAESTGDVTIDNEGQSSVVAKEMGGDCEGEVKKRKRKHDSDEEDTRPVLKSVRLDSQSSDTQDGGSTEGGKKRKKKNRQHKKKSSSSAAKDLEQLRVMSKMEWLSLKKIFKDVQKQHMKQLKDEQKSPQANTKEGRGYVGECLVKVTCEDGASLDRLQEVCSEFGEVAYIDIQDGEKEGFIRYKASGCVPKLLEADHTSHPDIAFAQVPDEEERAYFLKTQAERKQRYLKGRKHGHKRGQDKLISKVLKRNAGSTELTSSHKPAASVGHFPTKSKGTHTKFSDSDNEQ